RLEIDPVGGDLNYVGALADFRRYVMLRRPLTLAGRLLHFGRYGRSAEDVRLTDLYLVDPWLIHGYDSESFSGDEVPTLDRLLGGRFSDARRSSACARCEGLERRVGPGAACGRSRGAVSVDRRSWAPHCTCQRRTLPCSPTASTS